MNSNFYFHIQTNYFWFDQNESSFLLIYQSMMNYYLDHWHYHLLLSDVRCGVYSFIYIILHMFSMQTCNLYSLYFAIIVICYTNLFDLLYRFFFRHYTYYFYWKNHYRYPFCLNFKDFISYFIYRFNYFSHWFILMKHKPDKIDFII